MSASESKSAIVLGLAEEFLERYRQGERPSLKEYIDQHPELAAEIRDVFPAMALMENIALADESLAGEPAAGGLASSPPPQQLGDFRILREVGRGGMGIVYEAEQVSLGRHVALKVLSHKVLLDAAQKRRFEREARAAARLHHTNIVPVFGVGEQDGMPYYVMQFIQGLGLDEVCDELKRLQGGRQARSVSEGKDDSLANASGLCVGREDVSAAAVAHSLMTGTFQRTMDLVASPAPRANAPGSPDSSDTSKRAYSFTLSSSSVNLPGSDASHGKAKQSTYWQSVAQIGVQVAGALEYAHKQGIQHRDIKPSNLLLDTRGTVWVTDFGLARADNEEHLTQTGDIVGTLRYLPPEAFEGRTDARSDLYSLGLTLYELLALRPAFEEKDRHKLIKQVTTEEPTRLDKLNRAIPRDLVTIIHKAIDREPARRYQAAAELAADLQRFLDDEPIRARRVSAFERGWRLCRHHPGVASLTATLAVTLLVATVVSLVVAARFELLAKKEKRTAANERDARQATEEAKKNEALQRQRAESALYYSRIALADRSWQANEVRAAEQLLDQAAVGVGEGHRNWEWHYLKGLCHADLLTLTGHRDGCKPYSVAYSPDGRFLATAARDYSARVPDQPIPSDVIIWDSRSGRRLRTLDSSAVVWPRFVAYSLDGTYLAVRGEKPYKVWDTRSWEEVAPALVPDAAFQRPAPLRVHIDGDVIRPTTASGERLETLRGHVGKVNVIEVEREGHRLASAGSDHTVRVWDVRRGTQLAIFRGHVNAVDAVAFSPDGSRLASASVDGTVKIWDLGRDPRGLRLAATNGEKSEWLATFAFRSDSQRLDTLPCDRPGPCLRTLDAITGKLLDRRDLGSLNVNLHWGDNRSSFSSRSTAFAISPTGGLVAGPRRDEPNVLSVCDRATDREVAVLRGHHGPIEVAAFSPDGDRIATASPSAGEVKLWDAASGEEVVRLWQPAEGPYFAARALAFSPDGQRLAAGPRNGSPPGIWIWDVASGQRLAVFQPQVTNVSCLTFSADGDKLAVAVPATEARVLDAATGELLFAAPKPSALEEVAFSPDGRRLAGAGRHGEVYLWDASTGQEVLTLPRLAEPPPGNYGFVARVAFSPDGRHLAANNWDGTISVWSAEDLTPTGRAARLKAATRIAQEKSEPGQ